ncbi:MAG: hypothetical protein U9M95_01845, partial [Candidatus Altiarchaeota archaeon]|nr:hypothetical protein [Candidatus Altiarchaeota archaeon]
TNSYGDDACITFDTWAGDEVFVSKASVDTFCRLHTFKSYIAPIAGAVLSCWNGRHYYTGDTKCNQIDVSSWPPFSEVTVTEDDVIKYLEKVLNEPGVPVNFKSGSISSDWGTDHVCITYDTRWFNEVFVSKTSDEPLCS